MKLSPQQKKAVEHTGSPALVVAGAGSGKTRTLTAKIDYLLKQGYEPERILAITFTNKAAEEMKTRLQDLTGLTPSRFPWVRTYHSACFRILKQHCTLLGYETPLQIYTTYHQQKALTEILVNMCYEKKQVPAIQSAISNAKNSGNPLGYFDLRPRVARIRVAEVYQKYEKALKAANAVDFDNILLMTRDLLRDHRDVRMNYQELFKYILVDEYQDSNNLQEELTRLLLKDGNLFCVGDDWQAIYGFRGSNINHFLSFPDNYKKAKVFRLEQNYRSADEIVQVANNLIGNNRDRMEKRCFSEKRGGLVELHEFSDEMDEARWVARKAKSLHQTGIPWEQMGVLYRTKFCSLSFEKTFRTSSVPYQMLGSKGFFERKEILDLNCYLAAALFPKDDAAFDRILNTPKRGIGPGMLKKIAEARTDDMSLQDAARKIVSERVMTPKVHNAMNDLLRCLDDIRKLAPDAALREIITRFGYMAYLEGYDKPGYVDREENITQLIHSASQYETLLDYLEDASLVKEDKDEDDDEPGNGIRLSTIHASKGLEYYVVFIVGCEEMLFPHWRSVDTPAGLQEERRLMYVAVTRSEKYLYLSSAGFRRGQSAQRSRFIREIEAALED